MRGRKLRSHWATGALVLGIASPLSTTWADEHEMLIGYAGGFTGYLAPYDQPSLKGVQLAVEQLNAAPGVGPSLAEQIRDYFHPGEAGADSLEQTIEANDPST